MQATGIQIDGSLLRQATVKLCRAKLQVIDLQTSTAEVKPLYISGLSSNDLIIRSVSIPTALNPKMKRAVRTQIEAQLHLTPEELLTIVVPAQDKAIAYSTTRSALAKHLQELASFGADPERVSAIPAALMAFVHWKSPETSSYFLIDVGTLTNCIWVENGELQKAHAGIHPTEITKIIHSFQCQRPLIVTGEDLPKELRGIAEEKEIGLSRDEKRYAVCLGLAIDYLVQRKHPIQFRTSLSPRHWQKLGRLCAGLFATAVFFCGLIFGLSTWWMNQRETEIIHNLETWTMAKDPALYKELFSTDQNTQELVGQWLNLIEKNSSDYRYLIKAPRVAVFLDWLTHHPLVEPFRLTDPVVFEQIRYHLLSYPHIDALNDPYLAKVEIDFKVASPSHARKFHEALLKGDGLVDASREITWDVASDHYKVSFYLKNGNAIL